VHQTVTEMSLRQPVVSRCV